MTLFGDGTSAERKKLSGGAVNVTATVIASLVSDTATLCPTYRLQAAPYRPGRHNAAIGGVEPDDRRARAVVRRLLDAVREHEILAINEHPHQQREEQRQHQRHFDDSGAALLARQG